MAKINVIENGRIHSKEYSIIQDKDTTVLFIFQSFFMSAFSGRSSFSFKDSEGNVKTLERTIFQGNEAFRYSYGHVVRIDVAKRDILTFATQIEAEDDKFVEYCKMHD